MDRISRAGLTAFAAFALALVSGYAGAVSIPQGPDSATLHASDGIDFVSRSSKWEFQQAADRLRASGGFKVGGKGMGFTGQMLRDISGKQLAGGLLRAAPRLLGGWLGAATLVAPYVFDALEGAWKLPDGPDYSRGEVASLAPASGYVPNPCGSSVPCMCQAGGAQYGTASSWFVIFVASEGSAPEGGVRLGPCDSPVTKALFQYTISGSALCLSGPTSVIDTRTGKCLFKGSGTPATQADLASAAEANLISNPPLGPPLADWYMQNGIPFEAGDPYTEGPARVMGPTETTTTTSDAGTSTATSQHAWDMNYSGRDVYVADTETATATDEAGNTTTKTTKRESTGGTETDSKPPPSSGSDMCIDHPDASGCSPLGDVSDDPELPQQDIPVTFGYTSVTAICPAPKSFAFMGRTYEFSWEPACTFASTVRPVVIALALLGAMLFVVRVGRG